MEKSDVEKLIDQFDEVSETKQQQICYQFGKIGSVKSVNFLIKQLSNPSPRIRQAAKQGLIKGAKPITISLIVKLLDSQEASLRSQAMEILTASHRVSLPLLLSLIQDKDKDIRILSATILGEIKDTQAVKPLVSRLSDDCANVRYAAAEALGKIGDSEAIHPLIRLAKNDPWSAYAAVTALGKMRAKSATKFLEDLADSNEWLQPVVVRALGDISATSSVSYLVKSFHSSNPLIRQEATISLAKIDQNHKLGILPQLDLEKVLKLLRASLEDEDLDSQITAIKALGWLGDIVSLSRLLSLVESPQELIVKAATFAINQIVKQNPLEVIEVCEQEDVVHKEALVEALSQVAMEANADEQLVDFFIRMANSNNPDIRVAAAIGLANLGGERATRFLIEGLKDENGNFRRVCVEGLGQLKAHQAVKYITPLLNDPYPDVRTAAGQSLGLIGSTRVVRFLAKIISGQKAADQEVAVRTLGIIGETATKEILEALQSSNLAVRRQAIKVVSQRKIHQATPTLIEMLTNSDWQTRKLAVEAIGELEETETVDKLTKLTEDPNPWVRYAVVSTLGRFALLAESHLNYISQILLKMLAQDSDVVRLAVLKALSKIANIQHLPQIITLANSENEDIREAVAESLGNFAGEKVVKTLVTLSRDKNTLVQLSAVNSLTKIGSEAALRQLRGLTNVADPTVRAAVNQAIRSINIQMAS
jgi:HEAT repeat protein